MEIRNGAKTSTIVIIKIPHNLFRLCLLIDETHINFVNISKLVCEKNNATLKSTNF